MDHEFFVLDFFMCISVFPFIYVCYSACGNLKKVLDYLKLELQEFVCYHVGAGNQTQILSNSNKHSGPLSNLSSCGSRFLSMKKFHQQ